MKEKEKDINNKKQYSFSNPEPEFLNDIFCLSLKVINFLLAIYIIGTIILYMIIHFYGKELFKLKKTSSEYDRLLFINLFYDIYLAFAIVFSYFAIFYKSIFLYIVYWSLMLTACVFGSVGYTQDFENLNAKIRYIVLTLFGLNILLGLYPIFHYLRKVQYFRVSLESFPIENIIHEIKLRTDMMKIGYNNFVIGMKLHRVFPSITFKKEDYYFLSEECKNRSTYRPLSKEEKEDPDEQHHNQFASKSTADERNTNSIKTN